jgi:GLPGLI family protein
MKQLITLLLLFSSFAQAQFYEVEYETQVKREYTEKGLKWFEDNEPNLSERKKVIELNENPPKEYFQYIFNETEANLSYIKKVNNSQGEIHRFIIMPDNLSTNYNYYNYPTNQFLKEFDLYGRKFIITNSLIPLDFVDTNDTKEILGYNAKKAIATYKDKNIVVWYTDQIKYNYSPDIYIGVKGFVLEEQITVENEDGKTITKIGAIKIKPTKKVKIIKPTKGEKVSDKELNKIIKETNRKRDEMFEETNGVDKK